MKSRWVAVTEKSNAKKGVAYKNTQGINMYKEMLSFMEEVREMLKQSKRCP